MNVIRVQDANGTHIEPALDQTWDEHTKLQWHAAVVTHDTGIPITVRNGARLDEQGNRLPGWYGITVGTGVGSSGTALSFDAAWDYLNGVDAGAHAARTANPWPYGPSNRDGH